MPGSDCSADADADSDADGDHSSVGEDVEKWDTGPTPARYAPSALATELAGLSSLFSDGSKTLAPC